MDKLCSNDGFSLVESILIVFIISMLSLLFITPFIRVNQIEVSSLLTYQVIAMRDLKRKEFDHELWFNENGNINRAQTKKIANKVCVFNLGFGRFFCE